MCVTANQFRPILYRIGPAVASKITAARKNLAPGNGAAEYAAAGAPDLHGNGSIDGKSGIASQVRQTRTITYEKSISAKIIFIAFFSWKSRNGSEIPPDFCVKRARAPEIGRSCFLDERRPGNSAPVGPRSRERRMHDNARKCTIAAERLSAICWRLLKLCGGVSIRSGMEAKATAKGAMNAKADAKRIFKLTFFFAAWFAPFASFAVASDWIW